MVVATPPTGGTPDTPATVTGKRAAPEAPSNTTPLKKAAVDKTPENKECECIHITCQFKYIIIIIIYFTIVFYHTLRIGYLCDRSIFLCDYYWRVETHTGTEYS